MNNYNSIYKESIENKETFWKQQSKEIKWFTEPKNILSKNSNDFFEWFSDGEINMSYLCLDYHIEQGRGNETAIIYDSPVSNVIQKISYNNLRKDVASFAGGLQKLGLQQGDTVVIYMPMIPQAIIAMLACARIGVIHSVVFGGFAPHELALRIEDAKPKAIISASYGIEFEKIIPYKILVDKAIEESNFKPLFSIFYQRKENYEALNNTTELDFNTLLQFDEVMAKAVPSTHPLYILYTSGTTGKPKGIIRDHGGYATALKFSMTNIYNSNANDVYWAASDIGWVVGHSYIVYGPLIQGCTTILYEGKPIKTPDAGAFWRVINQHNVKTLFTAPTAIRAIKKEDAEGLFLKNYNLSCLQQIFLAGERCDTATYFWIKNLLQIPIIDHWWQTESGWPMIGMMTGIETLPAKAGSAGLPICGYQIEILNEAGEILDAQQEGYVCSKLPLPPGCLPSLWKNDERFKTGYLQKFEGYYLTGDGGYKDEDGYFYIMGRIDDVINVSGHRLSTGEMEEIVATHKKIAECAVVGIADNLRGQRPIALIVIKDNEIINEHELENELINLIREKIGAVAYFKTAILVTRLPKTRSGKILRKTIRQIADGENFVIPSTIDDPTILEEIKKVFLNKKITT